MATATIESYTAASTIDPVNDLLLEFQNSSGVYKSINRNVFLSLSSTPLGLTDTQSPTNKTFNNTNSFTIKDGSLTLQNSSSTTKQAAFSLTSITAGQTRTITIPDASGTLGLLGSTQTWGGVNTFTGSSWTGGTISNAAVSVDTITGFTVSNSGTIYGIGVTTGVITGANTVGSAALITNAVQGNQLATTAISLGYAPITTNFTTTSTTAVQVTGLTATVTIPSGGRKVKITGFAPDMFSNSSASFTLTIWDGTVGSGTQLGRALANNGGTSGVTVPGLVMAIVTPAAGSKTYNIGFQTSAGTGTLEAGGNFPAFILVEAI